ncbi:hypothetical protein Hanom_Chr02g00114191 [Helianthus anomalus]
MTLNKFVLPIQQPSGCKVHQQLATLRMIVNPRCHTPKIHTRSTTAWERDMTRIKPPIILNM